MTEPANGQTRPRNSSPVEESEQDSIITPLTIMVPPDAAGQRIDSFLASQFDDISRSQIRRSIEKGNVLVNETAIKPGYNLHAGERIQFELPESSPIDAAPEDIPLEIIFEDNDIIVINKPAGMVMHPGAGVRSGTLANALVHHLSQYHRQLPKRGGSSRPGIVHRLDVGTSGLVVAAKTDQAHLGLAEQFEGRQVYKQYIALVYGSVKTNDGRVNAPIGRDPNSRVKMSVRPEGSRGHGRPALTLFKVIERFTEFTLLDIEIKTGRTHQIRVHMAHIKHPVAADKTYEEGRINNLKDNQIQSALRSLGRPFLHAAGLGLLHPTTGQRLEFNVPLPDDLQSILLFLREQEK